MRITADRKYPPYLHCNVQQWVRHLEGLTVWPSWQTRSQVWRTLAPRGLASQWIGTVSPLLIQRRVSGWGDPLQGAFLRSYCQAHSRESEWAYKRGLQFCNKKSINSWRKNWLHWYLQNEFAKISTKFCLKQKWLQIIDYNHNYCSRYNYDNISIIKQSNELTGKKIISCQEII